MIAKASLRFDMREWLKEQAPLLVEHLSDKDNLCQHHDSKSKTLIQNYSMLLSVCLSRYESELANDPAMNDYFLQSNCSTLASDHAVEDHHGTDLGGGWGIAGFVLRSSIVLTLSVIEEFERGVIRILANHGSTTVPVTRSHEFIPRLKDYREQSDASNKAAKSTHATSGRQRLLRKYGVDPSPPDAWMLRLTEMRRQRNQIAHGDYAPPVTLGMFLQLHYDVWRSVHHLSQQVRQVQRIVL